MKVITIPLIVWVSFAFFSLRAEIVAPKFKKLKSETNEIMKTKSVTVKQTQHKKKGEEDVLQKLIAQGKRIDELLKQRSNVPVIWEARTKILTGKVIRGTLLNSINSTNTSSPVLVKALPDQGLPMETKFACQGVTSHARVFVLCNKMVTTEKEVAISAQLLNSDGSSGILGEYDDGKEEMIAGALISNFTSGVLSVAQSRVGSSFGAIRDDSARNQILQGFVESGKTSADLLTEEMKTKEPIVTVEAGGEVLVYFMEAVNEY